ncbi:MAG: ArsC/Spx/MgsR family protein [Robiginitalea sp.]|nr:ArsC/Spx/MgsR family protein [Robiginitalea sp.]
MKKIYHLSTCDTSRRILEELDVPDGTELQDIKATPINPEQLEALKNTAGSYEALFSKRARLYRERNLKERSLDERDFRELLLEHYTFLKRPVVVVDDAVFIGNAAKTVAAAKEALHS